MSIDLSSSLVIFSSASSNLLLICLMIFFYFKRCIFEVQNFHLFLFYSIYLFIDTSYLMRHYHHTFYLSMIYFSFLTDLEQQLLSVCMLSLPCGPCGWLNNSPIRVYILCSENVNVTCNVKKGLCRYVKIL